MDLGINQIFTRQFLFPALRILKQYDQINQFVNKAINLQLGDVEFMQALGNAINDEVLPNIQVLENKVVEIFGRNP